VLRLVEGRANFAGLRFRAFRMLDAHHNSRSSAMELSEARELGELLIDGSAEGVERSLAMRSLRSPIFSVPGSVQDKSAENMTGTRWNNCKEERKLLVVTKERGRETEAREYQTD